MPTTYFLNLVRVAEPTMPRRISTITSHQGTSITSPVDIVQKMTSSMKSLWRSMKNIVGSLAAYSSSQAKKNGSANRKPSTRPM